NVRHELLDQSRDHGARSVLLSAEAHHLEHGSATWQRDLHPDARRGSRNKERYNRRATDREFFPGRMQRPARCRLLRARAAGGRGAFDRLRVEKGYRIWGRDMWSEHDPFEAGLGFAVSVKKEQYVGRDALLRRKEAGPRRRLVTLSLDDSSRVVLGSEPVYN